MQDTKKEELSSPVKNPQNGIYALLERRRTTTKERELKGKLLRRVLGGTESASL